MPPNIEVRPRRTTKTRVGEELTDFEMNRKDPQKMPWTLIENVLLELNNILKWERHLTRVQWAKKGLLNQNGYLGSIQPH